MAGAEVYAWVHCSIILRNVKPRPFIRRISISINLARSEVRTSRGRGQQRIDNGVTFFRLLPFLLAASFSAPTQSGATHLDTEDDQYSFPEAGGGPSIKSRQSDAEHRLHSRVV